MTDGCCWLGSSLRSHARGTDNGCSTSAALLPDTNTATYQLAAKQPWTVTGVGDGCFWWSRQMQSRTRKPPTNCQHTSLLSAAKLQHGCLETSQPAHAVAARCNVTSQHYSGCLVSQAAWCLSYAGHRGTAPEQQNCTCCRQQRSTSFQPDDAQPPRRTHTTPPAALRRAS